MILPANGRCQVGRKTLRHAQRLKRVFTIDIETCPHCGGTLRVIACIKEPLLIAKILGHVQQREALNDPLARAPLLNRSVTQCAQFVPQVMGCSLAELRTKRARNQATDWFCC